MRWAKIAIPVAVVTALLLAVATRVVTDELPEGTAEAIESRFRPQLDALRQVAESNPVDPCDGMSADNVMERYEAIRAWHERAETHDDLIEQPAILGIEITSACAENVLSFRVKRVESMAPMWAPTTAPLPDAWPSVTLLYVGLSRVVRYETRFPTSPESEARILMFVDLKALDLR